jgi:hypothetical protein
MEVREILLDFIGCFWILRDAIGYKYYIYIFIFIFIYTHYLNYILYIYYVNIICI